ncbi:MAG: hypothetical protein HY298_06375 [Verrucomicrobia bacterium]|nr:hypothetical protein [Verrucomicrobiota bacterium]
MKTKIITLLALVITSSLSLAQVGSPEDAGLTPRTSTIDVNTNYNNNSLETGDITITSNTNVVLAYEDDDGGILDFEANWTVYSALGALLTPAVTITNIVGSACFATAEAITNCTTRSFFRSNGSPTPHYTGDYGGKAKGNWFGPGFGFMAGCDGIACEIPELTAINVDGGGATANGSPFVQLLNNDGSRNTSAGGPDVAGIVSFSDADTEPNGGNGDIRPTDLEFLSNGNIVIAGFSRQTEDRALTGQTNGNVVVYKVLNSSGGVVKAYSVATSELAGDQTAGQDAWHGVAATANGFAIRFSQAGDKMRLFDNNGNPLGTNINVAAVTGHPEAATAGRGDGMGFKGNGNDAYVYAVNSGAGGPWVTVFNANGTVRYSRAVTETNDSGLYANSDRLDAAIDEAGRVIVAFDASNNDTNNGNVFRLTQARVFDPCGNPIGPVFYVSERENATNAIAGNTAGRPRVAWRGNTIAVMWGSLNSPVLADNVLALRIFDAPPCNLTPCSASAAGMTTIVPDKALWYNSANFYTNGPLNPAVQVPNLGNWEPFCSVLGNSTFLIEANTFADDGAQVNQRYAVTLQPVGGGTAKIGEAFYTDAGAAYRGQINGSRQNGNPGRVAGDKRPGATSFIAGGESSPDGFAPFLSDTRWAAGTTSGMYNGGNRYGAVQTYSLNTSTLVQSPLHKAFDAVNGQQTAAYAGNAPEVSRFGGGLTVLDNGNSVVVIHDKTTYTDPAANVTTFAIITPSGGIVKSNTLVDPRDIWDNVSAFKGGFAVRCHDTIYFYNNAGNLQGSTLQSASGVSFDTGRGDGTRIASHIFSPYVYLAGEINEGTNGIVRLAVWDSRTRAFVAQTAITTCYQPGDGGGNHGPDRVNLAVDACDRVCVTYAVNPDNSDAANFSFRQIAARVVQFNPRRSNFSFLSPEFFPFVNQDRVGAGVQTIQTIGSSVAMTTKEICIAAKGSINSTNNPSAGADSATETTVYTVISHPAPEADPTLPILGIAQSGSNVIVSWATNTCDYVVQSATSVTGPYADLSPQPPIVVVGGSKTVTIPIGSGNLFVRLVR